MRLDIPKGAIRKAAVIAVALATLPAANVALAYFTSNAEAEGGFFLRLEPTTEIIETYGSRKKHVSISNDVESVPLYVRAKALSSMPVTYDGDEWSEPDEDGWVYYKGILNPGTDTENLDVSIEFPTGGFATVTNPDGTTTVTEMSEPQTGEEHDVIVVYETTPVLYDTAGNELDAQECWSRIAGEGR